MKIITNPPYSPLVRYKMDWKKLLTRTGEWVVLATWRFCNNMLEQQELVDSFEWADHSVNAITAISSSYLPKNKEERPIFYTHKETEYNESLKDYWLYDPGNIGTPSHSKRGCLRLREPRPEDFIYQTTNKYCKRGQKKPFIRLFPKGDYTPYEKMIVEDNMKYYDQFDHNAKIRQSIVDAVMEKEAEKKNV